MNADPTAEQQVIGSVVASAGAVLRDLNLTGEDFATPAHEELWRAVHAHLETGRPLTAELLAAFIRDRGRTQLLPALTECMGAVTVAQQAYWHAANMRTLTARRRLEAAAAAVLQIARTTEDMTPEELAEAARAQVDRFTDRAAATGGAVTFADAYLDALERWGKPDTNFLPTGWTDLDEKLTGGLRPGHLTIIGARPAVGKSLMATELAHQVAGKGGRVLFHSLEMTRQEVTDRITASVTKVPLSTLTAGTATPDELDTLADGLGKVADWPLLIDDRSGITVTGIRGKARDMTREGPLSLVIVDYLQLIAPYDRKAPREQQVASISRGLKLLAKDLHVPVVALAQINRAGGDKDRPKMHHLRESGAIEADADEILLLHRDDTDDDLFGLLEVNVEKNRHGGTGTIDLAWLPAGGTIGNA